MSSQSSTTPRRSYHGNASPPGGTERAEASPTRPLSKYLHWVLPALVLAVISVALQYGTPVQTQVLVRVFESSSLHSILHAPRNGPNDAATDSGSVIRHESIGRPSPDKQPWHPRMIEYSHLIRVATIQEGRLEIMRHPDLGTEPVLVKRAALPEYIESVSREAEFYRLLDGLGVTPAFLGHVTESGRVTGFVAEYVEQQGGGKGRGEDNGTEACLSALQRMHARGVAHGDAHGGNCLVRGDGSAALVDFELAEETTSVAEFERDLWVMRHSREVEE